MAAVPGLGESGASEEDGAVGCGGDSRLYLGSVQRRLVVSFRTEQGQAGDTTLPPLVTEPVRPGGGTVFREQRATVCTNPCYQVASLQDTVPKYDDVW